MRILHTSDWHLGRTFHGTSLHDTTETLLKELVELVKQEKIDVVLISGDVYDQAQPRTETVRLLDTTLQELAEAGATVVATSGNHDSAVRLGFASGLLAKAGVHLVTSQTQVGTPVLLSLGESGSLAIYGIPYLEPRPIAARWGTEPTHTGVLTEAMRRIRTDMETTQPTASIVLAHCFATGAEPSDSERDITVGGTASVPASLFDGATYTALGHLHGRQTITDTVRYSGSLLAYSFSEQNHTKGAWIIDLADDGTATVRPHTWATRVTVKKLRGELATLLADPALTELEDAFLSITLTDAQRPTRALDRLKERFTRVQELYFDPQGATPTTQHTYRRTGTARTTLETCTDFYSHVRGRDLTDPEQALIASVLEHIRTTGATA